MTFRKTPIPSKRFCIFWLLSVIVSGLIIYPALTIGFLKLGEKLPGLDGAKRAYDVKEKIAEKFHNKSVLFVVGGSSAYYGIDAALMEKRLGRTVINYGVHAGLGIGYQLFRLKKVLRNGDSVLLSFELDLLSDDNDEKGEFLHAYVATYDKRYFFQGDWKKLSKAVYSPPVSDWKLSIIHWGNFLMGKNENRNHIKMPHLLIDARGDTLYKQDILRPLKVNKFVGLGRKAKKELRSFISFCSRRGIQVYFTWETAVRHPDYFDEISEEHRRSILSFFAENGVVVLDECTDHLYPEMFYSNTYNHLNAAGRRIRTEKLIRSLRNPSAPDKKHIENRTDLFLIEVADHETILFEHMKEKDFDFRIYTAEQKPDADTIDEKGIVKRLDEGVPIYFNDANLKHLDVFEKEEITPVETHYRTLSESFDRYPDHIFFLVQNGSALFWDKDLCEKIRPMATFFDKEGYRAAVIGTGRFSTIREIVIQSEPIQLLLKQESTIGSFRLPFNVRLDSAGDPASGPRQGGVLIGDANFAIPVNGPGIWCVVYDPDLEIVTDRFFYESPGKNVEAELYCVKRKTE